MKISKLFLALLISYISFFDVKSMNIKDLVTPPAASTNAAITNLLNAAPTPPISVAIVENSKVIAKPSTSSILSSKKSDAKLKFKKQHGPRKRTLKRPLHKDSAIAKQCGVFSITGSCSPCNLQFGTLADLKYHNYIVHELENKPVDKV